MGMPQTRSVAPWETRGQLPGRGPAPTAPQPTAERLPVDPAPSTLPPLAQVMRGREALRQPVANAPTRPKRTLTTSRRSPYGAPPVELRSSIGG